MQLYDNILIFLLPSLITVAFYFFVKNAHWTIRVFAQEVMEKVDYILVCAFFSSPFKGQWIGWREDEDGRGPAWFLACLCGAEYEGADWTQPGLSKSDLIQSNQSVSDNKKDQDI